MLIKRVQGIVPEGEGIAYIFACPGCGCCHYFAVRNDDTGWEFNGNFESPTVSPSIRVNGGSDEYSKAHRCHLFLKEGKILYLDDCHHELRGKTVPMEPLGRSDGSEAESKPPGAD
jgi:hypothetical protein